MTNPQSPFPPRPVLALLLSALLIPTAVAQGSWTQRNTASFPPARRSHAMAYDLIRQRMVLFGGLDATGRPLNDTWEWDGTNWVQRTLANNPSARSGHTLTFDGARGRMVLFGGVNATSQPLQDTWEFDGGNWSPRSPGASPGARFEHAAAFDSARSRTVVFGGLATVRLNDTWEYDGTTWTNLSPAGSPPARSVHGLAFDTRRGRTVLFGGVGGTGQLLGDHWEWDGSAWFARAPTSPPSARWGHGMVDNPARSRVVLFGGNTTGGFVNEQWEWDGITWNLRTQSNPPSGRVLAAFGYDYDRGRLLLHGGLSGGTTFSDTWEHALPASYGTFGSGCAGSNGTPSILPNQLARVGQPFSVILTNLPYNQVAIVFWGFSKTNWGILPLPLDLTPAGMPGCRLNVSGELTFPIVNTGIYGAYVWGLSLANDPLQIGRDFFNQVFVFDPTANPTGLVSSNAGQGVVGR